MASVPKSVLETESPNVFRPGNSAAVTIFTKERNRSSVSTGPVNLAELKSEAVTMSGFLQEKPLMKSLLFGAVGQVSKTLLECATEIPRQENNTNGRKIKEEDGFFILIYVLH